MATLPTLTVYNQNLIPDKSRMTDEEFADAIHPYLNFWNGTTIPELNNWNGTLEQIRQEINDKYIAVKNQAVDGGYSQTYLDTKFNPPMSRTYYVDAVNGDDTNDGSSSGSPFKTIKKAIDSVPIGGAGFITLLSDVNVDFRTSIKYKRIDIHLNGFALNVLTDSISIIYGFYVETAFIRISGDNKAGSKIILPAPASDTSGIGGHPALFKKGELGETFFSVTLSYSVEVVVNSPYYYIAEADNNTIAFSAHGSITDNTGNGVGWLDLIKGVVKDANGVPRNILSNKVL